MGVREAALKFGIPKSTLHDRTKRLKAGENVVLERVPGGFKKTFSVEYEEELARHITDLSNRCMPLTKKEFLKLAYDLAEDQKIAHRFNKEKGEAGRKFYKLFTKNYGFSLRSPEIFAICRKSDKEGFIRCSTCKDWTHKTCAGVTKRPPAFLCHWCKLS